MDAVKLYRKYSIDELQAMAAKIKADPANQYARNSVQRATSIYLYTPAARRKLDAIAWAITYHLQENRRTKQLASKV